jgi:hypothetical protein
MLCLRSWAGKCAPPRYIGASLRGQGGCAVNFEGNTLGLLDGMLGNAAKIDAAKIQQELSQILTPGEVVQHAYQLIRDYFVFTDKRFVLVNKQGITGSKVEYHSIPYKSITHFSIETGGTFDLDAGGGLAGLIKPSALPSFRHPATHAALRPSLRSSHG